MRHGELDADGVVKRVGLWGGEQRGPIVEFAVPAEVVLSEPQACKKHDVSTIAHMKKYK